MGTAIRTNRSVSPPYFFYETCTILFLGKDFVKFIYYGELFHEFYDKSFYKYGQENLPLVGTKMYFVQ